MQTPTQPFTPKQIGDLVAKIMRDLDAKRLNKYIGASQAKEKPDDNRNHTSTSSV